MKVCLVSVVSKDARSGAEKVTIEVAIASNPVDAVEKVKARYLSRGINCREIRSKEPQDAIE